MIGKFPGSEPASHAQFEVASIFEVEKGDLAGAIERFRKVAADPWKSQANQRVAVMESKALTVVTPRAFRSGETAHLKITTRNLENLTFTAYKLNAEAYFRKKHVLGAVESLDVGLVAPDAEWTVPVKGYAKFKPVESTYDLKVAVPGVYVVKVTDEKTLQATALVVGSDLDAIVKVSREQVLVFAQDMKTGQGRKGARVLIADGSGVILEKKTGDDGVLLTSWNKPLAGSGPNAPPMPGPAARRPMPRSSTSCSTAATRRARASACPTRWRRGSRLGPTSTPTDRPIGPARRSPSEASSARRRTASIRNPSGESYKLEIYDARGRLLLARPTKLSEFGTFHEGIRLDSGAPLGTYRVRLFKPGQGDFAGAFEVQSYKLEKIDLEFDLARSVYYRGETIKADLIAKYQYGSPVAGRPVEVALPDGRTVRGVHRRGRQVPRRVPDRRLRRGAGPPTGRPTARRQRRGRRRRDAGDQGVPDRPEHDPNGLSRRRDLRPRARPRSTPRASRRVASFASRSSSRSTRTAGSPSARSRSRSSRPTRRPARGRSRSRSRTSKAAAT